MATYALLGATGQVGQSILTILFQSPDKKVNAFVRSKPKLERLSPQQCSSTRINIFEGDISNINTLARCISGTQAVFLAVAASSNIPGCRIAQDSAEAVIEAMGRLKSNGERLPRLVVLSSSETEASLSESLPWLVYCVLFAANSNLYKDLIEAEKLLRKQSGWISTTFVKPGGLSHDVQVGHELSMGKQQTFISFLDVAAGMVEVADNGDGKWDMKSVSVVSKRKAKMQWSAVPLLLKGLLCHFFPWLYVWLFA